MTQIRIVRKLLHTDRRYLLLALLLCLGIATQLPSATARRWLTPPNDERGAFASEEERAGASQAARGIDEPVHTEALAKIGATAYHALGHRGAGARVAVIDSHFAGWEARVAAGELPADVITRRFAADGAITVTLTPGDGPHGVACAEIIHDIAPAATLYLIQVESLRQGIAPVFDYLRDEEIQVASLSMSIAAESRGDGQGVLSESATPIYALLARAKAEGLLMVKSAGNYATRHYSGHFTDTDQDGWHEFGRSWLQLDEELDLQVNEGADVEITLSWDDWGDDPMAPAARHDYGLTLYDAAGRVVTHSTETQAGNSAPVDTLRFTAPTAARYSLRIRRGNGPTPTTHRVKVRVRGEDAMLLEYRTPANSLGVPADSADVLVVGAADVTTGEMMPYSSQGPTLDGRIKPDLTGYTNVSVSGEEQPPRGFAGTSAAAPHIAGMAALLWRVPAYQDLTVDGLIAQLFAAAADRGARGKDVVWGAGLAQLPPLAPELTIVSEPRAHAEQRRRFFIKVAVQRADGQPITGLRPADFAIRLSQQPAEILSVREIDGRYTLKFQAPKALPQGEHEMTVTAQGRSVTQILPAPRSQPQENAMTLDVIFAPDAPQAGEPVLILASLADHDPRPGAWLRAQIERPNGDARDPLTLYDDGMHADGVAEDGVYGAHYTRATAPGAYRVTLVATPEDAGAQQEITQEFTFEVQGNVPDQDGDGLPDHWEWRMRLNPAVKNALQDPDGDQLLTMEEYDLGSHPRRWDSDGDGLSDGAEVRGYFATSPAEADTDLGGVDDAQELRRGANPLDPADDAKRREAAYLPLTLHPYHPTLRPAHHALTPKDVWLATEHGLVRWSRADGSYQKYTTYHGLADNHVTAVLVDATGRVWAGTQGGVSVSADAGATWRTYTTADGLAHPHVRDLAMDEDGRLWAATAHGVNTFDGQLWRHYTKDDGLIDNDTYAVAVDAYAQQRVWIGTRDGVSVFDGRAWSHYTKDDGLSAPWVTDIVIDAAGRRWFATWGGGVTRWDPYVLTDTWTTIQSQQLGGGSPQQIGNGTTPTSEPERATGRLGALASNYVIGLVASPLAPDAPPAIHTLYGVSRWDDGAWTPHVSEAQLRAWIDFDEVTIDDAVHHWFGTRPQAALPDELRVIAEASSTPWYGLHQTTEVDGMIWRTTTAGPETPATRAIAEDVSGQLWFGAEGSIHSFDAESETWRIHDLPTREHPVTEIVIDRRQRFWIGTYGAGLFRFDPQGQQWTRYPAAGGQSSLYLNALAWDQGTRRLWVGATSGYAGLSAFDTLRETWENDTPAAKLARRRIADVALTPDGALWVGTDRGLSSLSAAAPRWITATAALPAENEIRALAFGPGGQVAIGMAAGLRRYDGTRWHTHAYTSTEDLAPGGVTALAFDSAGHLWAGTPHGVSRFDGDAWRTYTLAAGLPSDAITALYEDRAGRMWIGTQAGITSITED